ncbi:hypothetical protein CLL_A0535 [Clostridium botulinum B str. Eklund 17B (NRP)]|uniref:Uncharacterized protein n=1 Tax=Clostridium botulinum (strain Eklund 17B / Type B) TaxID=935198 RepID=B2TK29_CLOBB|nr:hypothetical protein CLL_A0535 [Clostridium botulinum B str. Eklund 17B (NRP)]
MYELDLKCAGNFKFLKDFIEFLLRNIRVNNYKYILKFIKAI